MKLPNKKYSVIYADPPWFYNKRKPAKNAFGGGASSHYPLMSFEDIYNLPVNDLADENCALFLWCTFPCLKEGLQTIERWGFTYKTIGFNWVKTNKKNDKPFFGVGYYTKSNAEVCLFATKGKMKPISNKVSSAIISPISKHSEKPAEVRDRIVQLYGDIPRIELFARNKTEGWEAWGNEVT